MLEGNPYSRPWYVLSPYDLNTRTYTLNEAAEKISLFVRYTKLTTAVQEIRDREKAIEEAKWERQREKHLEKVKDDLQGIRFVIQF